MKRSLFLVVVLLLSVSATAQLSLSWPASQATEVFSNCGGVTVSVVVHNDADTAIPAYTVKFRRNADYYLASSVRSLAPHSSDTLPLFQDAGLQPASYHIAVALLDSIDSIRTTIQVVYCRNAGIDSVWSPQPHQTVVEGDPFPVQVSFSNFGYTAVSSLYWLVTNVDGAPVLPAKSLSAMNYGETVSDVQTITIPMGIYGSKTISITLQPNDQFPADNIATIPVFVKPAYNPQPLSVSTVSNQCRMSVAPVSMSLINAGGRTIMAGDSIKIGYSFYSVRLGVPLSDDASHHEEWYVLPNDWNPDSVIDIVFAQPANLDPSAWGVDISLRLTGWASHLQDSRKDSYDTITSGQEFVALHAPSAPIASDSHIPYASRTVLRSAHSDYFPKYSYADTSSAA
ncbi:MAG: hypothetical protein KBT04_03095 [Bacteroidales bacterium]|nr:hypothetical protein [Candidatus Colimorpha onthohippi]